MVVQRLRQLERALDVLAGRLEVALAPVAARAPPEDLGAEEIAGKTRLLGELQSLAEQADRRSDAREVVPAHAHPEQDSPPVDVREARAVGERPATLEQPESRLDLAALHPGPRLGRQRTRLEL